MCVISPAGTSERIVRACSRLGNERSSMYCAAPVTLSRPSLRSTLRPTALRIPEYRQERNHEVTKDTKTSRSKLVQDDLRASSCHLCLRGYVLDPVISLMRRCIVTYDQAHSP